MDTASGSVKAAAGDPRFLAAVAILIANDHWWKSSHGSWLTGKLSDVAGLLVLGVLAQALSRRATARRLLLALIAVVFVVVKSFEPATAVTEIALDWLLPWNNTIVTDPSDAVGLVGLAAARMIVLRPIVWLRPRTARHLAIGLGLLACVATSQPGADAPPDLIQRLDSGTIVQFSAAELEAATTEGREASVATWSGFGWEQTTVDPARLSTDQQPEVCDPSAPERCHRLVGAGLIEVSDDGGTTWIEAWSFDPDLSTNAPDASLEGAEFGDSFTGLAVADDGTLFAQMKFDEPLIRDPEGRWSRSEREYRDLPAENAMWSIFGVLSAPIATLIGAALGRTRRQHALPIGVVAFSAAVIVAAGVVVGLESAAGNSVRWMALAVLFVVLIVVIEGVSRRSRATFPLVALVFASAGIGCGATLGPLLAWQNGLPDEFDVAVAMTGGGVVASSLLMAGVAWAWPRPLLVDPPPSVERSTKVRRPKIRRAAG